MAIAYQTSTTGTHDGTTTSTTHTVTTNKPTGLADGDCLVLSISTSEDSGSARAYNADPVISGWTKVSESAAYTTSVARRQYCFIKYISSAAGEPASYDFTVTSGTSNLNTNMAAVMARFSGVNSTPVDANSTYDGETTSTTMTFNGVTTTVTDTMLVMCGGSRRNVTTTYNDGTKIADAGVGTTAGNATMATMGYLAQAATGASGNKTATISGGVARENDAMIVALKASAVSGITITSITPSTFDDGHTGIVVAGSGFGASQGSSTITIGGQAQTVTAWSNTSITFTAVRGSNSMGAGELRLTIL